MNKDFLKNIQVNGTALPDVVIDTIMQEHARALDAAKADPGANGGTGGKTFTQEEVNRIVSDRLNREREKLTQQPHEDEREKALKAREARLDCRDYLDSKKYPAALLDVLDSSDVERFKGTVDKLAKAFPMLTTTRGATFEGWKPGDGRKSSPDNMDIANAFKPPKA